MTQPTTPSAWSRATPGFRAALMTVFAAEAAAVVALVIVFGPGRGLAYFTLGLAPVALFGMSLPIWWSIKGKTFPNPPD